MLQIRRQKKFTSLAIDFRLKNNSYTFKLHYESFIQSTQNIAAQGLST